jgi:hypothetical protein
VWCKATLHAQDPSRFKAGAAVDLIATSVFDYALGNEAREGGLVWSGLDFQHVAVRCVRL